MGIIEVGLPCINLDFAAEKNDSVGRVLPAYELRLEDVGLGGTLREISFRGKGMLDAYYHPWRTRDEIMPDGWFSHGRRRRAGRRRLSVSAGRRKDVISVMGMKFFPQEVETVLVLPSGRRRGEPSSPITIAAAARFPAPASCVSPGADQRGPGGRAPPLVCAATGVLQGAGERSRSWTRLPRTASGKLLHRMIAGGTS